uniref:Uncharacterized protein n=1 Tax=Glossina palpalis gambiensis TaxID=67801 RepID=A0A1B0BVI8_9MUSC
MEPLKSAKWCHNIVLCTGTTNSFLLSLTAFKPDCSVTRITSAVFRNYTPPSTIFAIFGKGVIAKIEASNLTDAINHFSLFQECYKNYLHHINVSTRAIEAENSYKNKREEVSDMSNQNKKACVNANIENCKCMYVKTINVSGVANQILFKLIPIKVYGNNKIIIIIKCERSFISLMDKALTNGLKLPGKADPLRLK